MLINRAATKLQWEAPVQSSKLRDAHFPAQAASFPRWGWGWRVKVVSLFLSSLAAFNRWLRSARYGRVLSHRKDLVFILNQAPTPDDGCRH